MSRCRPPAVLVLALAALTGCTAATSPSSPAVADSWRMPSDICQRLPLHRLALDARWQVDDVGETGGSPLDTGLHRVADCSVSGQIDVEGGAAPLDGGILNLLVQTASDPVGGEIIRSAPGLRGAYEGAFAARGPYETTEVEVAGWWSEGSLLVFSQDARGESPGATGVTAVTRVTVSGEITDDNLAASVLVSAQVLADGTGRVARLKTLTLETLRALEDALDRTEDA